MAGMKVTRNSATTMAANSGTMYLVTPSILTLPTPQPTNRQEPTGAVAVAGSSLLTGCSGYAPVQHAPGTSNTVLKVVSTLEQVTYDKETNTTSFRLVVKNGRKNALEVTKANFAVKADGYLADQNNKLEVTSPDALSYQVKQGETVTYHVMAKGLNALTDGPVTLTFYPDLQYPEFNANWELAAEVLEPDLSDPSTT